jgi:hypothetical protein
MSQVSFSVCAKKLAAVDQAWVSDRRQDAATIRRLAQGRTSVSAAARAFRDGAKLDTQFPARYAGQNYQSTSHQAYGAGFGCARASTTALGGDDVIIQRHCTISRQGAPASDSCAVIQRDALKRENVSCELGARTESRGAANHPKHVLIWTIGKNNRRAASGRERTTYLKNEHCIAVTVVVQSQLPCQLSRSSKKIHAVPEIQSTQVLTSQGARGRHAHSLDERFGQIKLSLT